MLAVNIQADVFTKAAYISYLEQKINKIVGETIIFWGNKIAFRENKKSAMVTSQFFLFLSYFVSFAFLTIYSFNKLHNWAFLLTQIGEVIILAVLSYQLKREHKNVSTFIKRIDTKISEN
jgi:hypothetical protein